MTIAQANVPTGVQATIQDRTLERRFYDALYAAVLYRGEAVPELWQANIGERQVFTKRGLVAPKIKALVPGKDPVLSSHENEQWEAEAAQYGDGNQTHMPTSHVSLASTFLSNTQALGLGAGRTLDRLARNRMFVAALAGEAMVTVVAAGGATQIRVSTINGFTQVLAGGRLQPVSAANPRPVTFTTVGEVANNVTAAVPDDPDIPLGSGTLTLAVGLAVGVATRDGVFANNRTVRTRVGGGATVDALTPASILTLDDIIAGVTRLRAMNVPPHADNRYHVHLTPEGEQQLFADNHWQRIHQSLPDGTAYREYVVNDQIQCYFYRNTENPLAATVTASEIQVDAGAGGGATLSPEIGGELTADNSTVIRRELITGGVPLVEKYLDESAYITPAGVLGKIGQFSITNNGVALMANRIRYLLNAPQDMLQQVVNQAWS
ncbi:MAG: hypothetical protein V3W06_05310, partial [Acidimicrobiia bacterium]